LNWCVKQKRKKNLSVKAEIKTMEIKGVELTEDLLIDLQNVTSAALIKCVPEFTDRYHCLTNGSISVNIEYRV